MKLPLRHLQINPQDNEFADDHPDYPKDAGQCMRNGHDYDAILDADGEIVADNAGYYPTGIDRDAAAHIVKCVNLHDKLVEALKRLSSATPVIIGGDRDQLDEAEEYAEIVLAEASEEAMQQNLQPLVYWLKEYHALQTQAWQVYFNWLAMWGMR